MGCTNSSTSKNILPPKKRSQIKPTPTQKSAKKEEEKKDHDQAKEVSSSHQNIETDTEDSYCSEILNTEENRMDMTIYENIFNEESMDMSKATLPDFFSESEESEIDFDGTSIPEGKFNSVYIKNCSFKKESRFGHHDDITEPSPPKILKIRPIKNKRKFSKENEFFEGAMKDTIFKKKIRSNENLEKFEYLDDDNLVATGHYTNAYNSQVSRDEKLPTLGLNYSGLEF